MSGLVLVVVSLSVMGAFGSDAAPRRVENFNRDWRFAKGTQAGAETVDFNDTAWLQVRLPHDWAISGPYEPQGDPHTGKLPWRGEGWYRKSFTLPAADNGKRIYLDFDGVMAMPTVYVNGQKAGGWDYGYMSFRVDATDFVKAGKTNVVAVHVDTRQHNSRWYPGAGIYRKVQLVVNELVQVAQWGTFVTTSQVLDVNLARGFASLTIVRVETTLENHTGSTVDSEVETTLLDPKGKAVANVRMSFAVPANGSMPGVAAVTLEKPQLWDIATPRLYTAVTRVFVAGKMVDSTETPFGIRTFAFTPNDGFHLNGRRVQLHGVCLHSDLGPLGMAFNTRAMERELQIMQDMGVNAVRTSHNPPAPELLDLCDRMGIVVWDEAFDKWDGTATLPKGVSIPEHGKKQYSNFVRRDRNHPCVVVWSVGNEIWDLEGLKYPDAPGLLKTMVGFVKALDTTRPVGLAQCVPESAKSQLPAALDVAGWNYARRYANSRERWPNLPIVYSESASAFSTRGYFDDFPMPDRAHQFLRPQLRLVCRPGGRGVRADGEGSFRGGRVCVDGVRLYRRAGPVRSGGLGPFRQAQAREKRGVPHQLVRHCGSRGHPERPILPLSQPLGAGKADHSHPAALELARARGQERADLCLYQRRFGGGIPERQITGPAHQEPECGSGARPVRATLARGPVRAGRTESCRVPERPQARQRRRANRG
jgi:beta-galactosidase